MLTTNDRLEIIELIRRADECATRRDTRGYLALFTADAVLSGDEGSAAGRDAIRAQVSAVWSSESTATVHLTSSVSVVDGGPGEAQATSGLVLIDAATGTASATARIHHRLIKHDRSWRFIERRIESTTNGDQLLVDSALPYGGSPENLLDVYQTPSSDPDGRAAIILIHGGGWFRGSRGKELALATRLAHEGHLVFAPDYREAPAHTFPASRRDILTAADWALASGYQFDRSRVAFFGGSAGGNLAVEAGIATGRPAVSWSGIFDLARVIQETEGIGAAPTGQDLDAMRSADINQTGRDDAFLRWTVLQEVGNDRSLLEDASVTRRVLRAAGPVFLANSLAEFVPVWDPVTLQAAFAAAGLPSTLHLIPGTRHAEGYTEDAIGPTVAFLRDALGHRPHVV